MDGCRVKKRADNTFRTSNFEIVRTKTDTFALKSGSFDQIGREVERTTVVKNFVDVA